MAIHNQTPDAQHSKLKKADELFDLFHLINSDNQEADTYLDSGSACTPLRHAVLEPFTEPSLRLAQAGATAFEGGKSE